MPVASATLAISPPSASISLTRWPLATPPMAGLQDICATISSAPVRTRVRAPRRAAASAASQPAWPAPTTMTSYSSGYWYISGTSLLRRRRTAERRTLLRAVRQLRREVVDVERQLDLQVARVHVVRGPAGVPGDVLDLDRAAAVVHPLGVRR